MCRVRLSAGVPTYLSLYLVGALVCLSLSCCFGGLMGPSKCEWISRVLVFTVYMLVGAGNASVRRVLPGVMLVCEEVGEVGEGVGT